MSVYVDNMRASFRGMKMCHMIADSHEELLEMAEKIQVHWKWIQKIGTYAEHFDICLSRRSRAVNLGAIELTQKELVRRMMVKTDMNKSDKIKELKIQEVEDTLDGKELTLSKVLELNPNARYLIKFKDHAPIQHLREIQGYLRAEGLDCIVVGGDFELYKIEK